MRTAIVSKYTMYCAFCRNWYDPANSYIRPLAPNINKWEYDPDAVCMCMVRNVKRRGCDRCSKFELKITLKR